MLSLARSNDHVEFPLSDRWLADSVDDAIMYVMVILRRHSYLLAPIITGIKMNWGNRIKYSVQRDKLLQTNLSMWLLRKQLNQSVKHLIISPLHTFCNLLYFGKEIEVYTLLKRSNTSDICLQISLLMNWIRY